MKKSILATFVFLLMASTIAFAQTQNMTSENDCSDMIITDYDKVTGVSTNLLKEDIIVSIDGFENKRFVISFQKNEKFFALTIKVIGGSVCIEKDAEINILFIDGTRLTLATHQSFNCKGELTVFLGDAFGNKKEIIQLRTKKIDIMRIHSSDGYFDAKFRNRPSGQFKDALNCLSK
jgi:hypothetical protein